MKNLYSLPLRFHFSWWFLAILFLGCAVGPPASIKDQYANFKELSRQEKEGTSYKIQLQERRSPLTILAIHGGEIDKGTELLAAQLAGKQFNLYIFEGNRPQLHLTSTHFDEPRALSLAKRSRYCLSIHGLRESQKEALCLGGGNPWLKEQLMKALKKSAFSFDILDDCPGVNGNHPLNIVNRCQEKGVQLEFTRPLRERLLGDKGLLDQFNEVVRRAVELFLKTENRDRFFTAL
jgi:phage replication-related protein YjqB (UPF0714/DUF867 family)